MNDDEIKKFEDWEDLFSNETTGIEGDCLEGLTEHFERIDELDVVPFGGCLSDYFIMVESQFSEFYAGSDYELINCEGWYKQ